MAHTLEDCTRIVRAVRRAGTRFLLWNRNGAPAIRQAGELLERGALGALRAIHVDFYFAKDAGPRIGEGRPVPPDPGWEPLGELSVEGIYPLAYIARLARSPAATVFARAASHFHQRHRDHGIEDLASLSLRLHGGVLASVSLGRIGRASHPDLGEIALRLVGSDGSAVIAETAAGGGGLPPRRGAIRVSAPAGRGGGRTLPAGRPGACHRHRRAHGLQRGGRVADRRHRARRARLGAQRPRGARAGSQCYEALTFRYFPRNHSLTII